MLGMLGSILGISLTLISWLVVEIFKPSWIPPIITKRLPLEIHLVPAYAIFSVLLLVILSIGAASLPARRAAHQSIVEALGHA
jgi:putative ABC transport system permease protein